ncbi:cobalt transporter [Burkholderia multivorans]|nr:cobalt transporter [Burkholderia multivorans]
MGEVVIGILSRSEGPVSDGIHSLSDLTADFVVLLARHHSRKPVDEKHTYGHQRVETDASLGLAATLLLAGVVMLRSAIQKLEHLETIARVHVAALWVALVALAARECPFRYMLAVATRVKSSMLVANVWPARSNAASSLAVACGIVSNLFGYPLLHPVGALTVGGMIVKMGATLGWDALHDLMNRAADAEDVLAIRATLIATWGVPDVHDLRTRKVGDLILVDVHPDIDVDFTVGQGHDIAVDARARVMKHVAPRQRERVVEVTSGIRGR